MVLKQQIIPTNEQHSRLDRFTLSFEYDKTIQQVKHDIRIRALDKSK